MAGWISRLFGKASTSDSGGSGASSVEPADPLAQAVQRTMRKAGLSRHADGIIASAMNSICMRTQEPEDELPVGASKIGGLPDLPPEFEWPRWTPDSTEDRRYERERARTQKDWAEHGMTLGDRPVGSPISFIAQINMAETAPHDLDHLLPSTGILYFFYDAIEQPGGCGPADPGGWRVLYYAGEMSRLASLPFPDDLDDEGRFDPLTLTFAHEVTLPAWESVFLDRLGMSTDEQSTYSNTLGELGELGLIWQCGGRASADEDLHRMLGHPEHLQGDVFLDAEHAISGGRYDDPDLIAGAADWVLLLQVDSTSRQGGDPGMMWGDVGLIYFCIRPDDLRARDFSNVWVVHQCG